MSSNFMDIWDNLNNIKEVEKIVFDTYIEHENPVLELDSTMLKGMIWDNESLFVQFKNESEYCYFDVPFKVFAIFTLLDVLGNEVSVGQMFNDIVKGEYNYARIK